MGGILASLESDVARMEADKKLSANQPTVPVDSEISNVPAVEVEKANIANPTVNDAVADPEIGRPPVAVRTSAFTDTILSIHAGPSVGGNGINPAIRLDHPTSINISVVVDAAVKLQMSVDGGTTFYDLNDGNDLTANTWTPLGPIILPKDANIVFATSAQCTVKEMYVFA